MSLAKSVSLLALAALLAPAGAAQEPKKIESAQEAPKADPRAPLVAALEGLTKGFVARGLADRDEPESPFGGAVVMMGGPGGGGRAKAFTGKFEAWRDMDGSLTVVSKRELPGFGYYQTKQKQLVRTTYDETPVGLKDLRNDLRAVLDAKKLLNWAKKGTFKETPPKNEGTRRFTCVVKNPVMPGQDDGGRGGLGGPFRARVIRLEMAFVTSTEGKLKSARLGVVRSDPMAAIRKRMQDGGGSITLGADDMEDDDPEDGVVSVFDVKFSAEPSLRARSFRSKMTELLKNK